MENVPEEEKTEGTCKFSYKLASMSVSRYEVIYV